LLLLLPLAASVLVWGDAPIGSRPDNALMYTGFDEISFNLSQTEVLSLVGEITTENGEPLVHGHVVLGRRDGSTLGGHLLRGVVRPILIVTVNEWARSPSPSSPPSFLTHRSIHRGKGAP
jgi:predicted DNA-binding protein with PD1-like motif